MDGPFEQYAPHLDVASWLAAVVCVVVYLVVGPIRGRTGYRRLIAARAAGVPGVLVAHLRRAVRRQAAVVLVVLVGVLVPGGPSAAEVGLRLPVGPHVAAVWGWTAYLCGIILVTGLVLRGRARSGHSVPGQRMFRALIPDAPLEQRWGAAVSVGAGVAEELAFRGLLMAAAVASLGLDAVTASAILCALFGLAHLYQGWRGMLATTLVGALLAYLYLASGSLLPAIVVHVVLDLRALVLVPAQRPDAERGRPRRATVSRRPSATPATDLQDAVGDDRPVLP